MKRAQAMVETLVAVLLIVALFDGAWRLSRLVAAKTLLDHAAARAARAKAVGLNEFMCLKTARASMIPVAGKRLWPDYGFDEVARIPIYMASEDASRANGVLEYELWGHTDVNARSGGGISPTVKAELRMDAPEFSVTGSAQVESHFPLYMFDSGW